MPDERKTVNVHCAHAPGLLLRTFEARATGGEPVAMEVDRIEVRGGFNPGIDAGRFARWLEQNQESDLVKNGVVTAQPEETEGHGH